MAQALRVHHLNIFLVKSTFKDFDQIVKIDACAPPVAVPIAGHGAGQLYIKKNPPSPPRWADLFAEFLHPAEVAVAGVAALFVLEVGGRKYALAFGQGGRHLLKDDVHEERFGLLATLNSVSSESLRCVDVQSLDAIQSHSRIQAGQASSPDQFGLDVEQDMLKAVVGAPVNQALGTRMSGSDSLSVAVSMKLSDLPTLLRQYTKSYEADISGKDYEWVNNISMTKSAAVVKLLEAALDARLAKNNFQNVWLAIPEIIDWDSVAGFVFTHGKNQMHPDITMEGFLKTVQPGEMVTLELMRQRRVHCVDSDFKRTFKEWSVFRCFYAELDTAHGKFILNDGSWFKVDSDFVQRTNDEFKKISRSKRKMPSFQDDGEGEYNIRVATFFPQEFALLDAKHKIFHGGGHGQVEVCDLFSIDRELIHVKIYGKSSVFSHLFSQGFVSGQLIQIDQSFRKKIKAKLKAPFSDLIPVAEKPAQNEFRIVYGVISTEPGDNLQLPFFSRVNLNNTAQILRGFGYKVELLKIHVEPAFAKTVKVPPKKGKK
jgi:uncharacterized protein (TIGR04141 family)